MPSTKPHHINGCQPPDQPEHLPCPRCDSTNTKFCYYNNYNFSQPRHFCKACRRYWTHGGTLRDIPVGGGSRKNAKRSRVTTNNNNNIYTNYILEYQKLVPTTTAPIMFPLATGLHNNSNSDININVNVNNELCYGKPVVSVSDSFTSLLNGVNGPGMFGLGVGGLEDGFGFGRGNTWQLDGSGNTWQLDGGEGLSLPELAICTPGMI